MMLSIAAKATQANLIGTDGVFSSVGIDSRNVLPGQLFVALKGEHFDGHDFARQAIEVGAAAVIVNHEISGVTPALVVKDTYQALGELAAYHRSQMNLPLVAITGSNGKTSVKEMLASILKAACQHPDEVLATQGNLNNHIGLPLTLLKLAPQHRYAVAEMGMNHSGEISYLSHIAKPNVAIINNAASAHIGELGSMQAIAHAKAEIFDGLEADGVAVINADDDFAPLWKDAARSHKVISFGLKNKADVSAHYQLEASASKLEIKIPHNVFEVNLPVPGLHNVSNALAATAAALALGITQSAIVQGLENYMGVPGRLQHLIGVNRALVIDDSYNANPGSMKAAVDVLKVQAGEKILVLGDMGEMGEGAEALHADIGLYAKASGINTLLTLGTSSAHMTQAFGSGARHYETVEDLNADLLAHMTANSAVLVKGSRFMKMERIVKAITVTHNKQTNGGH